MIAFFDEARQVIFDGMIGNAGQRGAQTLSNRAGGQDDIQFTRSNFGILVEGFVKIAQAEEQERIWILSFDFQILLADGSDIVGHGSILLLLASKTEYFPMNL